MNWHLPYFSFIFATCSISGALAILCIGIINQSFFYAHDTLIYVLYFYFAFLLPLLVSGVIRIHSEFMESKSEPAQDISSAPKTPDSDANSGEKSMVESLDKPDQKE